MLISVCILSHARRQDTLHPDQPAQPAGEQCTSDAGDAAALVLRYVEARVQGQSSTDDASVIAQSLRRMQALEERLAELETVEMRAAELQRTIDVLKADNEQLRETIRRLEIGFRRHISEVVSSDQLKLALAADATAPAPAESPSVESDPGTVVCPPPPPEAEGDAADGSAPEPPKKNRHSHGRRRMAFIPKVIIETLPAEVRLKGIENFERIGEEDTSMLGHRRGGPIEVVFRRPKFVVRNSAVDEKTAVDETAVDETAVDETAVDETAVDETAVDETAADDQESSTTPADAESEDCESVITLFEHEIATVPSDAGFKSNPFVDGAIVRYTPESSDDASNDCAVLVAPLAERPIERSMVDASLLAHLLVGKLDYHTPYYRQEVESARMGYPISRTNMARWQYEAGTVANRISDAMWHEALARSWIGMDATGTAIQAKSEYRYGHVFVLVAPGDGVLFRYTPKYDADTVRELFGGFTGTIVADASANHNVLFGPGKAREAGCFAHARKPFVKALRAGEGKDAAFALQIIQALFCIEQRVALASPQTRLEVRQRESAPLVDALYEWVDRRLPEVRNEDTFVRKGLVYLDNQRVALREFLQSGEIPIHNNASERALRRIVKGRANWLSHGSDEHAQCACAISSLIASCQLHDLDPELYLQEVLTVAPSWPLSRILELSPKNWVATRQRLIAEGRLTYLDFARIAGSQIALRPS